MTPKQKLKLQDILTKAHNDFDKGLNARAFYKVNNHGVSGDLVQDTFIKTWSYLVKGGKIDTMKAFLYHILNNLIIDQYRKHKTTSLDVLLEKGFEPSTDEIDEQEHSFNILEGKNAFFLIKKLPKTYQKVMRMRYVQDLSLKEISLVTGQSKNSVAVQIHRGLVKLRVSYKQKCLKLGSEQLS
jgi:RNA polymerase sigma-70 factor (ECF subfamily)